MQFTDIDECAYNSGQCDHSCVDTNGSYNCTCNFGYSLYEYNGFQGLNLQPGEDGSKPWHSYHIGHSCVCKFKCYNIKMISVVVTALPNKVLF